MKTFKKTSCNISWKMLRYSGGRWHTCLFYSIYLLKKYWATYLTHQDSTNTEMCINFLTITVKQEKYYICYRFLTGWYMSNSAAIMQYTIIQQSHFLPLLWISGKWQLSHKHQLSCRCWCQAGEGQPCLQPLCLFLFHANCTHLQKGERKKVHPYSLVFLFFCESLCQYIVNTLSRLFMDHLIHSKTFEF